MLSRVLPEDLLDVFKYDQRITSDQIAAALGTSTRTVHRHIATLRKNGHHIESAPGFGFVYRHEKGVDRPRCSHCGHPLTSHV